jgi:dolichyl-phosphate-mannose-protein mannosyltransferase
MEPTVEGQNPASRSIHRWEILTVCVIVAVGFGLRFSYPDRLAIEHFDEGVYASNVWFGETKEKTYPEQQLYAPPLLPTLIECLFLVSGPSNRFAFLPGQIAGALTPVLLWWIGRTWFGPITGCVAAILCALSEVHILLSRSTLTDVPLGLWWLLAMLSLRSACTSGRTTTAMLAGGFVGLAWWTKYNGWMPLGIALAGILLRAVALLRARDPNLWSLSFRALKAWTISAITAGLIWAPWIWSLQPRGGYAAVMANHRRYVVGLAGWGASLSRQLLQFNEVSGPLTMISFLIS